MLLLSVGCGVVSACRRQLSYLRHATPLRRDARTVLQPEHVCCHCDFERCCCLYARRFFFQLPGPPLNARQSRHSEQFSPRARIEYRLANLCGSELLGEAAAPDSKFGMCGLLSYWFKIEEHFLSFCRTTSICHYGPRAQHESCWKGRSLRGRPEIAGEPPPPWKATGPCFSLAMTPCSLATHHVLQDGRKVKSAAASVKKSGALVLRLLPER